MNQVPFFEEPQYERHAPTILILVSAYTGIFVANRALEPQSKYIYLKIKISAEYKKCRVMVLFILIAVKTSKYIYLLQCMSFRCLSSDY
jgi:hypothetical protein